MNLKFLGGSPYVNSNFLFLFSTFRFLYRPWLHFLAVHSFPLCLSPILLISPDLFDLFYIVQVLLILLHFLHFTICFLTNGGIRSLQHSLLFLSNGNMIIHHSLNSNSAHFQWSQFLSFTFFFFISLKLDTFDTPFNFVMSPFIMDISKHFFLYRLMSKSQELEEKYKYLDTQ